MKQLGKGWEYRVYEWDDTKVLKIPRSFADQFCRIVASSFRDGSFPSLRVFWAQVTKSTVLDDRLRDSMRAMEDSLGLLGNPTRLGGGAYLQDKVTSMKDYLQSSNREQRSRLWKDYCELVIKLWNRGIGDPGYNMCMNCGVYPDGTIIQLDVTSLSLHREYSQRFLRVGGWRVWETWAGWPDGQSRSNWFSLFSNELCLEAFEVQWGLSQALSGFFCAVLLRLLVAPIRRVAFIGRSAERGS